MGAITNGVGGVMSVAASVNFGQGNSKSDFLKIVDEEVASFKSVNFLRKLEDRKVTIGDYHRLLTSIYHQSRNGALTFALAGSNVPHEYWEAQSYLIKHAEEEKAHWQWTLNDLKATNFHGVSPTESFPSPATFSYIAFNFYVAHRYPVCRLAIAAVLESLGANYGKAYAQELCRILNLKPEQVVFFYGHGDTDVGHTQEILSVIDKCNLDSRAWEEMCYVARTGGQLYRQIYNEF